MSPAGVDGGLGRGTTAYDPLLRRSDGPPNACLGPLEKGPLAASRRVIGDLCSKGG